MYQVTQITFPVVDISQSEESGVYNVQAEAQITLEPVSPTPEPETLGGAIAFQVSATDMPDAQLKVQAIVSAIRQ